MDNTSFAPGNNSINSSVPPLTPQYSSPEPKHLPKLVTWVVLILALGLSAFAGIWYWQDQKIGDDYVAIFTPRPSTTPDPTADWKTYTNTQYGFEFKYPNDWTGGVGSDPANFNVRFRPPENTGDAPAGADVWVRNQKPGETLESVKQENNAYMTWRSAPQYIGGQPAIIGQSGEFAQSLGYVIHKGKVYTLHNELITNSKILSTFKFTDSADTSTWKTYTNTQYGFELKYPGTSSVIEQGAMLNNFNVEVHYDKNNNSYEPQRVIIASGPDTRAGLKLNNTNEFIISNTDSNGENYIHFSLGAKGIYANCLYSKDQTLLDFCNSVLSTFKFTK